MRLSKRVSVDTEFQVLGDRGYTGSLNDRQFYQLGDMGFTGSLTDRFHSSGANYYDQYVANGKDPGFVADFSGGSYWPEKVLGGFSDALTFARAGNATMVDSDGLLKWAPHNLHPNSTDLGAWSTKTNVSVSGSVATFSTTNSSIADSVSYPTGQITAKVKVSSENHTWVRFITAGVSTWFNLTAASVGTSNHDTATITADGDGYILAVTDVTTAGVNEFALTAASADGSVTEVDGAVLVIEKSHLYRSDLGGMVNNPDRGDSYVPTTSQAVYLPRVGHHVWNGSAWVNEGILHESEARTNLLTYSEDLSDAAWTKASGVTIGTPVTRNGISLDLIENAGGANFRNVTQSVGSVADGEYLTLSCFIEAGTSTETAIRVDDVVSGASSNRVTVPITWTSGIPSLQADVTLGLTFVDASLQDWEDGVYRVHLTVLNGTGGSLTLYPKYYIQWNDTAAAVNTYAGGFQAEIGPTPSSYIPNAGATSGAIRAAETLTIPSANLPWPTPNVIGDELVTNGTFDSDVSGWDETSVNATLTFDSGEANVVTTTSGVGIRQQLSLTVGKVYQASVTLTSNSGTCGLRIANAAFNSFTATAGDVSSGTETISVVWVAQEVDEYVYLRSGNAADFNADNISVREIDPLAVSIAMEGRVTYADEGIFTTVRFFDWTLDANNNIIANVTTESAFDGQLYFTQEESGVVDNVNSDAFNPGINVPFNIASRHGSTFINGAVDGTALTEDTDPVALPDLSATDLALGETYMGTIKTFRVWADDLGDAGIEDASA